jgi:multidrug efflux pump subunit AcrA (membrane-fusion protein)
MAQREVIPEKKALLKPEMTANINIITAERENVLLIPAMAVSRQAGEMYANVPAADPLVQEFDRKPVELGINDGEKYELLAGLNEGDTVVISGEVESRWSAGGRGRMGGSSGAMRVMRMGSRGR